MPVKRRYRVLRRGVTLVDLVVTVLILGLTAAVAVPRFSNSVSAYSLEAAARRMSGVIDYASQQARTTSRQVTIAFDAATNSMTLSGIAHPDHAGQSWTVSLAEISESVNLVSVDFGGSSSVVIGIDGRPHVAGSVLLAVGAAQKTVSVSSSTGKATSS